MKKEIEAKAIVSNPDLLFEKLAEKGIFLNPPIIQHDQTFVDDNYGNYAEFQQGKNILRIREQIQDQQNDRQTKFIFTLKQPHLNEFDSIEKETEISDPASLREALIIMGYKPITVVQKSRRKAKYHGYEICVDEVLNLGTFIEVEKMTDEPTEVVQEELFNFLKELGVNKEDMQTHGYDTLTYMKQQNLQNNL